MDRRSFHRSLGLGALGALIARLPNPARAHTGHVAPTDERLPMLGRAPPFALIDQAGRPLELSALQGKVLAQTFIYTRCTDTCPILTARLVALQQRLGADFASRVHFVSITVDPDNDTPAVLLAYARAHGVDLRGWSLLTGPHAAVQAAVHGFGSYARQRRPGGTIDHLTLTSLIDRDGRMRVQYLGTGFREDEFLRDLRALLAE